MAELLSGSRGGFRVLEWTGSLVPQGALVKGELLWSEVHTDIVPPQSDPSARSAGMLGRWRTLVGISEGSYRTASKLPPLAIDAESHRQLETCAVGAKGGWQLLWRTFMQELAPQSDDGDYVRPSYTFNGRIGDAEFPVRARLISIVFGADSVIARKTAAFVLGTPWQSTSLTSGG